MTSCSAHNLGLPRLVEANVSAGGESEPGASHPVRSDCSRRSLLVPASSGSLSMLSSDKQPQGRLHERRCSTGNWSRRRTEKARPFSWDSRGQVAVYGFSRHQKPNATPIPNSQVPLLFFQVATARGRRGTGRTRGLGLLTSWTASTGSVRPL